MGPCSLSTEFTVKTLTPTQKDKVVKRKGVGAKKATTVLLLVLVIVTLSPQPDEGSTKEGTG